MKVIGFANKFYTLWEVTESTTKAVVIEETSDVNE